MRLVTGVFLLLLAPITSGGLKNHPPPCPGAGPIVDEKNGFRAVKLGTAIGELSQLREIPQDEFKTVKVKAYERREEEGSLFGQKTGAPVFFFFEDHLFLISIGFSGGGLEIMRGFENAFGCKSTTTKTSAATHVELYAAGEHASLFAQYIMSPGVGSYGSVDIYDHNMLPRIESQIKVEARQAF